MRRALPLLFACVACTVTTTHETPEERGAKLADDPHALSASQFNALACSTCHAKPGDTRDVVLPGAPLEGAASRPSYWGGRFVSLYDSVAECATHFQRASSFDPTTPASDDLYAYLVSIGGTGPTGAQPFTVLRSVSDLPAGDAARGELTYSRACGSCHGAAHTGAGKIMTTASTVPEDTQSFHGADGPTVVREVVIEKIRHGSYLGFAGVMPPFSTEVLSDSDVADLASYLGLYP
jgi:thiosulfate dehydrogenase